MVQPVFCKVDTGSCFLQYFTALSRILFILISVGWGWLKNISFQAREIFSQEVGWGRGGRNILPKSSLRLREGVAGRRSLAERSCTLTVYLRRKTERLGRYSTLVGEGNGRETLNLSRRRERRGEVSRENYFLADQVGIEAPQGNHCTRFICRPLLLYLLQHNRPGTFSPSLLA